MPVRFKTNSEYKTNYKWLESRKSASFHPSPEQGAPQAGIKSADLSFVKAEQREPPIQHKRYPVDPMSKITSTTKMYIDDPSEESSEPVIPPKATEPRKEKDAQPKIEMNGIAKDPRIQPVRDLGRGDEKRDKSKTYKLEPRKDKSKTYKLEPKVDKKKPIQASSPPKETKPVAKHKEVEKENLEKDQDKVESDRGMKYRAGMRRKDAGPKRLSEYQRQFAWKAPVYKESPLIAAEQMIYNSNAIPSYMPDKAPRKSEYDSQFQAWNQVQPTQQEMLVEHAKKDQKDQEAKQKKRVSRGKRKKSSPKANMSPDQMPAAGVPGLQMEHLKAAQNPQKPFFPSGPIKKWKSEYRSNYRDPRLFGYMEGVWRGADPPHIQPRDDASDKVQQPVKERAATGAPEWFAEVVELRKKAQEYQKRARGTHFSREHLAQLLAQQARLWDQESETTTSTITASEQNGQKKSQDEVKPSKTYTKETAAKQQAQLARQQEQAEEEAKSVPPIHLAETQPVRRKLAWPSGKAETESSIGSIPTPEGYRSHTSPRDSAATETTEEENGRIPTPRLAKVSEVDKARHHLARTTPAIGGALLTSPSFKAATAGASKKSPALKPRKPKSSSPPPQPQRKAASDGYHSDDEGSSATPLAQQPVRESTSAGVLTRDPDPLETSFPASPFQRHSENFYETSPARPRVPDDRAQLRQKTWAGIAVDRDEAESPPPPKKSEEAAPKKPSEAWTVPSGLSVKSKSSMDKKLAALSNGAPLLAGGQRVMASEDAWSNLSTISSRSSCSLASEVLERARKRRDEFWGNQPRVQAK